MDIWLLIQAAIMGLVEGITEFLPISSTGHLILTAQLLDFWTLEKRELFAVAVQIGAIVAVIYEYWGKLWGALTGALKGQPEGQRLSINLIVASIPIVIIGLSLGDQIKAYLFNAITVAIALIVGGIVILWAEKRPHRIVAQEVEQISFKQAILIGLIQCLALIPGTSRSGSTIIGGLLMGVSRKAAAEFSFFLGIPVLMGAGLLDLYKSRHELHSNDMLVLGIGMLVAFISALIVIRALIRYVSKHDFSVFAYYRIVFGLIILLTAWTGWVQW
ncbi:MAG: undecaprenyl-diphosphate phosphatase [Moraxellaceae bacterium]|nr:MAG: undecaprenyl-diphosphate phosphatase [Moraxellaceae bacterium]